MLLFFLCLNSRSWSGFSFGTACQYFPLGTAKERKFFIDGSIGPADANNLNRSIIDTTVYVYVTIQCLPIFKTQQSCFVVARCLLIYIYIYI